jgi:hypothetical protein
MWLMVIGHSWQRDQRSYPTSFGKEKLTLNEIESCNKVLFIKQVSLDWVCSQFTSQEAVNLPVRLGPPSIWKSDAFWILCKVVVWTNTFWFFITKYQRALLPVEALFPSWISFWVDREVWHFRAARSPTLGLQWNWWSLLPKPQTHNYAYGSSASHHSFRHAWLLSSGRTVVDPLA